jgi:hypothetical protein
VYNQFLDINNSDPNSYHKVVNLTGFNPSYQFVATSQGSQCGVPVLQPGANMMYFDDKIDYREMGSIDIKKWEILIPIKVFAIGVGTTFAAYYKLKAIVNALPQQNTTALISHVELSREIIIKTKGKICAIGLCASFTLYTINTGFHNISGPFKKYSPNGILPYESYAGGTDKLDGDGINFFVFNPIGSISNYAKPGGTSTGTPFLFSINISTIKVKNLKFTNPTYSYISRVSALDIANPVAEDYTRMLVQPINGLSRSRANKYICQEPVGGAGGSTVFNLASGRFTKRNANWMFNEMQNINSTTLLCEAANACFLVNNNLKIEGNTPICSSQNFSVANLPPTASVVWNFSPSNGIVSPTYFGNEVRLTRTADGILNLGATVSLSVCSPTISIPITAITTRVGIPPAPSITLFTGIPNFKARAVATQIPLANYNWYEGINLPGFPPNAPTITTSNDFVVDAPCRTMQFISVSTSNACGESAISARARYRRECKSNTLFPIGPCAYAPRSGVYCMVVEPTDFPLELMDRFFNRISPNQEVIRGYEVINENGELILERREVNAQVAEFDLSQYPDGAYTVIIKGSTDYVEQHLLIHSLAHTEEQIAEDIANNNLFAANASSADALNVLRQELFHQIQLNPDLITNSPTLQSFYLANYNGSLGKIDDINEALNNLNVAAAQTMMNNWTPVTTLEYNCFNYYTYFIRFLNGEVFTTNDVNGIYALANKCPQTNGEIIHAARSLYNFVAADNETFEYACGSNSYARGGIRLNSKKHTLETTTKIDVYPNPSKGVFNIKIPPTARGLNTINIFDMFGKIIYTEVCIAGTRLISLKTSIPKGVYNLQVINSVTNKTQTQKMIIQ